MSLAEQYPGPYATLLLADLGADVVLIERPGGGDPARGFPGFFESLSRNKRSCAIDLKSEAGRDVFLRLASDADVVLEGYRPGVAARLGVDYAAVREVNEAVVYVSITAFGQSGPMSQIPAHDLSLQAMVGLIDSSPGPVPKVPVSDLSAGMFGALAAVTGLLQRARQGATRPFDVAMFDGLMSWMTVDLYFEANGLGESGVPPREPAYGIFATADESAVAFSVGHEDRMWRNLCSVLGIADVAELDAAARRRECEPLRARIAGVISTRTRAYWANAFAGHDVPFAPVLEAGEVIEHPQAVARDLFFSVPATPENPSRTHVRQPLAQAGDLPAVIRPAPELGEHTAQILGDLGYLPEEISRLARSGAIACG